MKMIVKGRHMAVTPPIREYAEEKIGRTSKIMDHETMTTEVELYVEKNPSIENNQVAEITVFTKGPVIRSKEAATDMYAAIDLAADKLERQFRKYKGKKQNRHSARMGAAAMRAPEIMEPEEPEAALVKTKIMEFKPMTLDEAILQMELLGHDFFVFNAVDNDAVNVLYRRHDGDFGLIESRIG
ncbi:MAG: ribosome-associated translation inhibitor RaiA [Actinomycetota bacterium]|jgi:putative sigma-54 modulation protein|nr:ribosome-associated translation inhibitor RaiA [Actinomycetota bacterium]